METRNFQIASPWSPASLLAALLALLWLTAGAAPALAQAPPVPAPPGPPAPAAQGFAPEAAAAPAFAPPGQHLIKVTLLTFDQYSYQVHPFFTLTGNDLFEDGEGAGGGSWLVGSNGSDKDSNFVDKVIHLLPPFALEYTWNLDYRFIKGVGVGLDYAHIYQTDQGAAGKRPPPILPRFEMDTYYIAFPVRFYGFDPQEEGINYFLGFSLGVLNGNMLLKGTGSSGEDETIHFGQTGVGATRLGIEVNSTDFGFRYEVMLLNPRKVAFDRNPFPDPDPDDGVDPPTEIDMSGSLIRMSLYYKFGG